MKRPNYAPAYCALYPQMAEVFREHGYALAVHGTMGRDFDLVAAPWTDNASDMHTVLEATCKAFAVETVGDAELRSHGRRVIAISFGFGECFADVSFMPLQPTDANLVPPE